MRRSAKKDDNHNAIRDSLLRSGFSVMETHQLGDGKIDMVVALRKRTVVVEIKNPKTKGKLNDLQQTFFDLWQGEKIVARCAEDVLKLFGLIK
jgi:hypothetical protein